MKNLKREFNHCKKKRLIKMFYMIHLAEQTSPRLTLKLSILEMDTILARNFTDLWKIKKV